MMGQPAPAAIFFDGKSATAYPVRPSLQGDILRIYHVNGQLLADWPLGSVRGNDPHKAAFTLWLMPDEGARLVVHDPVTASCLHEWALPILKSHKTKNVMRWIVGLGATIALCAGLWLAAPTIFAGIAGFIPFEWEERAGKETRDVAAYLLTESFSDPVWLDNAPEAAPFFALVERLQNVKLQPESGIDYTFKVSLLEAPIVNAFAMPGGYIIVTTGLVEQCRTPEELAGVIGHEMGHVTERHSARQLVRTTFIEFLGRVFAGGSDTMSAITQTTTTLLSGKFSREDEQSADVCGVERLARAGIDPKGVSQFFAGLVQKEAQDKKDEPKRNRFTEELGAYLSYLSTHPALEVRQETLERLAKEYSGPYTPAISADEWAALKYVASTRLAKSDSQKSAPSITHEPVKTPETVPETLPSVPAY